MDQNLLLTQTFSDDKKKLCAQNFVFWKSFNVNIDRHTSVRDFQFWSVGVCFPRADCVVPERPKYNIDSLLSRKIFLGDDHGGESEHGLVERGGPEPHVGLLVIQLLLAVAFGLDGHERADGGSCWAALVHFDQKICVSSILREIELEQLLDIR